MAPPNNDSFLAQTQPINGINEMELKRNDASFYQAAQDMKNPNQIKFTNEAFNFQSIPENPPRDEDEEKSSDSSFITGFITLLILLFIQLKDSSDKSAQESFVEGII